MPRPLKTLLFLGALVLAWEATCRLEFWESYVLPSPLEVLETLVAGFADLSFLRAIWISLWRLLQGYAVSLIFGVTLGVLIGRIRLLQETLGALLLGLQTLPSICWLPLALLWFGLNDRAILFVVILGGLLAVTIATEAGVRSVPPIYLRAARTMGARCWSLHFKVILPAALPSILTGMKLGWSFAWRSLMAGELLFVSGGLGQLLMMGREFNDMRQVIAVMLVIVMLGLLVDIFLFGKLEEGVRRRWGFGRP